MDQLMRETASVDNGIVGQVAKNHLAAKQHRGGEDDDDEITVVEMEDVQKDGREELDGLTMEELRSLLQNFQNLSRQEQADMIAYMRRLEVRDPEKVRRLKLGLPQWNSNGREDDVVVQQQSNGEAGVEVNKGKTGVRSTRGGGALTSQQLNSTSTP